MIFKKEIVEPKPKKNVTTWNIHIVLGGGHAIHLYSLDQKRINTELDLIKLKIRQNTPYAFAYSRSKALDLKTLITKYELDIKEGDLQNKVIIPSPNKILSIDVSENTYEVEDE